jgi:hypothetical protein
MEVGHVAGPSESHNGEAAATHFYPYTALTGLSHREPEPLLAIQRSLGVFPSSPVPLPRKERRRRRGALLAAPRSGDGSRRAVGESIVRINGTGAKVGNTYNTDVNSYPEPATTTPPTRREHPTFISFFPSSLDAS